MRLLAVTLLAFTASTLCAVAWLVVGPGEIRARAFAMVLLSPLLWAVFMVAAYWDARSWRPAAVYAGLTALSVAVVLLADPLA